MKITRKEHKQREKLEVGEMRIKKKEKLNKYFHDKQAGKNWKKDKT
jgi:hypothetical protein